MAEASVRRRLAWWRREKGILCGRIGKEVVVVKMARRASVSKMLANAEFAYKNDGV